MKTFFYRSNKCANYLIFHASKAIVRRADHHDGRSGDDRVGQGGVIHKVCGKKYQRKLVGVVEYRNTRRGDQAIELKRGNAQAKA